MQPTDDAFWDELGIAWRASVSDPGLVTSRLQVRLKTQWAILTLGAMLAGAATAIGLGLAVWTLWLGWSNQAWHFMARGATIAIVSIFALMTALTLRSRNSPASGSLRALLQLSVERTERLVRAADLGGLSVLLLALGGTVGYGLRLRSGNPPAVSLVADLLALALAGLALLAYRGSQARALRKFRHLNQAFGATDTR